MMMSYHVSQAGCSPWELSSMDVVKDAQSSQALVVLSLYYISSLFLIVVGVFVFCIGCR